MKQTAGIVTADGFRPGSSSSRFPSCEGTERRRAHLCRFAPLPARIAFRRSIWRFLTQGPNFRQTEERGFPPSSIPRPALLGQWVVLPTDGFLGPPMPWLRTPTADAGQSSGSPVFRRRYLTRSPRGPARFTLAGLSRNAAPRPNASSAPSHGQG